MKRGYVTALLGVLGLILLLSACGGGMHTAAAMAGPSEQAEALSNTALDAASDPTLNPASGTASDMVSDSTLNPALNTTFDPANTISDPAETLTTSAPTQMPTPSPSPTPTPDPIETMLSNMTLSEKVGQLFIIRPEQIDPFRASRLQTARSVMDGNGPAEAVELTDAMRGMLERYPAGGFALFAKNIQSPEQVTAFNQALTQASGIQPFLAVDEEGGRVARLANHAGFDLPKYKSMWTVGASGDPADALAAGNVIGEYLHEYGFNLDFAPVADLTTNPNSNASGIGDRSFGSDPQTVAQMVRAFSDGLHEHGVLSCLKHFPGHGDTSADTHNGFVAVRKSWDELLARELVPYTENFGQFDMIMASHVTALNAVTDGMPATLSWEMLTGKLRHELGYDGLIITDAMEMGAITNSWSAAQSAVMALESGCDIILIPQDYPAAFEGILAAVWTGRVPESRIDTSVRRILTVKYALAQNAD